MVSFYLELTTLSQLMLMANYRRLYVPGGTYSFTLRLQDPTSDLLVSQIDLLRNATRLCMKRWPFEIAAAVILPNKLHMIWNLPPDDAASVGPTVVTVPPVLFITGTASVLLSTVRIIYLQTQ